MHHQTDSDFRIKDCALVAIATGKRAQNLRELRDVLSSVHPESIYYHFWGGMLRPRFDDPEFKNDFAAWAQHALHEPKLAERLGVIDPTDFVDMEHLRQELVEVVEDRLDESEIVPWARADQQFVFIRSQIVVFDTNRKIVSPEDLAPALKKMSLGSIFYHFIDARRRTSEHVDDFCAWLCSFGTSYKDLCWWLAALDPYFSTLAELREELSTEFEQYFGRRK